MYYVGIDVGGTFTDYLVIDEVGDMLTHKVFTTADDVARGVVQGLREIAEILNLDVKDFLKQVRLIVHGTTLSTNAILTGNYAKTGLITTEGLRDELELRRGLKAEKAEPEIMYNTKIPQPKPIVPRYLRLTVKERVDAQGRVLTPLNEGEVERVTKLLAKLGVEAIAICFVNSYVNPSHEKKAAEIVSKLLPDTYLTVSTELVPEIRFYERLSTTVMNTALGPLMKKYLEKLTKDLSDLGFSDTLLIMQSNGGVASPEVIIKQPVTTLLSGPAAGPVAGIYYAEAYGGDCITIDMGGTSFDVSLVVNRKVAITTEGSIGWHKVLLPMVDVISIGAGGGSIAWIDPSGLLRVGPQSAGAMPGPACYGRGGDKPTVTDADLLLGYLNPLFFYGGRLKLDVEAARKTVKEHIADPLRIDLVEAAEGIYKVVNQNMAGAMRLATVERGYDPRRFPLVVAGGAGPLHACALAEALEIPMVIVPRESSVFCATGMLISDLRHDYVRTYKVRLNEASLEKVKSLLLEMAKEGRNKLLSEGVSSERISYTYQADMRYIKQYNEVRVNLAEEDLAEENFPQSLAEKFNKRHEELYGWSSPDVPVELINLRVTVQGTSWRPKLRKQAYAGGDSSKAVKGRREIYIEGGYVEARIYDGFKLMNGNFVEGPAIIELPTTTILVPPRYDLRVDENGSYLLFEKGKEDLLKEFHRR